MAFSIFDVCMLAQDLQAKPSRACDHRYPIMPVMVEQMYSVTFNDSPAWRVPSDCIKRVDGVDFLKVKPYDMGFIKFVCAGMVDIPKRARLSLAQCEGFKSLIDLRNDAAAAAVTTTQPSVAEMLFGRQVVPNKKSDKKLRKTPKINAAKLAELR